MDVSTVSTDFAKDFLDAYHPLHAKGSLRGALHCFAGYEDEWPTFIAVFVYPRSRWRKYPVVLELSRLAWSPLAQRSASTFLRKCMRILGREYDGLCVTYALPGTSGVVYERAGFYQDGYSGGASWGKRGPGERPTPPTIWTGRRWKRFLSDL